MTIGARPPRVALRPAGAGDLGILAEWRNDNEAVRFSATGRRVSADEHAHWLTERLADPATSLWIAEEGGVPVGQVRVDSDGVFGVVSLAVAAEHRGRGVAGSVLSALIEEVGSGRGSLRAVVHAGNLASRHVFERAGFRAVPGAEGSFLVLEYHPQAGTAA